MTAAKAIKFIERLAVPTGSLAGKRIKLAPYQKQFLRGALAKGVNVGVLSVARGGGKSALTAGVALGHLLGEIDPQPRRESLVGARSRDQARIIWDYVQGLSHSLPDDIQKRLTFRRAPRLEVEFEDDTGPHIIRNVWEALLYEISLVTRPAYKDSEVSLRSWDVTQGGVMVPAPDGAGLPRALNRWRA